MNGDFVSVRRGKKSELVLYDVSEEELEQFEKGATGSLSLSFSLFFLSAAISFIVALSMTSTNEVNFIWFVGIIVGSSTIGLMLLILWLLNRRSTVRLANKIRQQLPADRDNEPISLP